MKLVKTDLCGLNALQVLSRARIVRNQMKGNPLFPAPIPGIPEFEDAIGQLADSVRETYDGGSKAAFLLKQRRMDTLSAMLKSLASYVSIIAQGDNVVVLSAGFEQRHRSSPITSLPRPLPPRVRSGAKDKTMELRWKPVRGARMYKVYIAKGYCTEVPGERIVLSSKSRCTIDKLDPLEYYTFHVQAIGARTEGPLSQGVTGLSIGVKAA